MARLLLLDGNSLTYRAFFALPPDLATASGQVTNAVYGFTSMLVNLVRDHQPDALGVAFDRPEPTFRHERVAEYKATRDATPDVLRQQMGLVRQVLDVLNVTQIETVGFEADDVIATLATRAAAGGDEVIIVTGDRDAYQLVHDPLVKVLYNKRGVSDYALYDEAGIEARTGVRPELYVHYAALRGDPSDNLEGVPGVGEKKAATLLNSYGSVDGIYEHLDELTPKLRENLAASEERVRRNCEVMVLVRDVPLEVTVADLTRRPVDVDAAREVFNFLEFRGLWDRMAEAFGVSAPAGFGDEGPEADTLDVEVAVWATAQAAHAGLESMVPVGTTFAVVGAWVDDHTRAPMEGIAVAVEGQDPAWVPYDVLVDADVVAALAERLTAGPVHAFRAKELSRSLAPVGLALDGLGVDVGVAAYLLDPAETRYDLTDLALRHLKLEIRSPDAAPAGQLDLDGGGPDLAEAVGREAAAVLALADVLTEALERTGMAELYRDVERPLVGVLARMEVVGVGVDRARLDGLNEALGAECDALRAKIWEAAGEEFNVNSTPQLREILFDKLGLTPGKKTKTGYSTDAQTLETLRHDHEVVDLLLRYREVEKLRSTYGTGLAAEVAADGRIHATFGQTVARTGRLSSDQPNLHNIPVRTEEGRRFREAFVPAPDHELLVADYDQIELRVIAHLADDPGLIEAFRTGTDIHNATAARIFGVDPAEVDPGQRSKAKMVSYGLAYGMEAFGLAQRLGIPTGEAKEILDAYFEAFPKVKSYMDRTVAEARERGYTVTLRGRRRPIPELLSNNWNVRAAGERQAMNAGIQGTAADIFKVALVQLDRGLRDGGFESRLILQVHDEVMVEVAPGEHDRVAELVRDTLVGAETLSVPLAVHLAFGPSWAEAKG